MLTDMTHDPGQQKGLLFPKNYLFCPWDSCKHVQTSRQLFGAASFHQLHWVAVLMMFADVNTACVMLAGYHSITMLVSSCRDHLLKHQDNSRADEYSPGFSACSLLLTPPLHLPAQLAWVQPSH